MTNNEAGASRRGVPGLEPPPIIDGDLVTDRLLLHPFTVDEASRVIARRPAPGDRWHPEYPFADELGPLRALVRDADAGTPATPFTLYMIRARSNGLAVGGIGFVGPPDDTGTVEVGYGLVRAARGCGVATEALLAVVARARELGARSVAADTTLDNTASQRVLAKAGFREKGRTASLIYFVRDLRGR
jgi:RimJ/RimL family protein N-acetyltransferase